MDLRQLEIVRAIAETGSFTGAGANVTTIGSLGAEVMADAILRAVREATGVAGYPAVRDLRRP